MISRPISVQAALTNLTFVLAVFCYLKLVPLAAEIQPFAFAPALLLILAYRNPLRVVFGLYAAGLTFALFASLFLITLGAAFAPAEALQSYIALLAPAAIFVAILLNAQHLSATVVLTVIGIWTAVGFSQAFMPELQTMLRLDTVFSALISRYSPESLRDWGRGATLLAPEPSYSARTIFLFIVAVLYLHYRQLLTRMATSVSLAACLFLAFVNQSATVAVILLAYAALLYPVRAAVAGLVLGVIVASLMSVETLRFAQVAVMGYDLVAEGRISDVVGFTNAFGSQRTISVAVAYGAVATGRFLGGGLGSWSVDFLSELSRAGIEPREVRFFTETLGYVVDVKPYSHIAMIAFELGIIGLLLEASLLLAAFRATHRTIASPGVRRFVFSTAAVSLLFLSIGSPVSAPEFWVALALALNLRIHAPDGPPPSARRQTGSATAGARATEAGAAPPIAAP